MPVPLLANDIIQVRVYTGLGPQVAINTFHFRVASITGSPSLQNVADAADAIFGDIATGIRITMGPAAYYYGVQVYAISRTPMPVPATSSAYKGAGSAAGTTNAPKVSAPLTSWKSDFVGPSNRGRTFWPFMAGSFLNAAGDPTAGYLAAINLMIADFSPTMPVGSGGNIASLTHVIKHTNLPTTVPITSWITKTVMGSMHKRGDYGKTNSVPAL